jgi:hypothetical protein
MFGVHPAIQQVRRLADFLAQACALNIHFIREFLKQLPPRISLPAVQSGRRSFRFHAGVRIGQIRPNVGPLKRTGQDFQPPRNSSRVLF